MVSSPLSSRRDFNNTRQPPLSSAHILPSSYLSMVTPEFFPNPQGLRSLSLTLPHPHGPSDPRVYQAHSCLPPWLMVPIAWDSPPTGTLRAHSLTSFWSVFTWVLPRNECSFWPPMWNCTSASWHFSPLLLSPLISWSLTTVLIHSLYFIYLPCYLCAS